MYIVNKTQNSGQVWLFSSRGYTNTITENINCLRTMIENTKVMYFHLDTTHHNVLTPCRTRRNASKLLQNRKPWVVLKLSIYLKKHFIKNTVYIHKQYFELVFDCLITDDNYFKRSQESSTDRHQSSTFQRKRGQGRQYRRLGLKGV